MLSELLKHVIGIAQTCYPNCSNMLSELLKHAIRKFDDVATISSFQNGCLNNKEVWLRSKRGEILGRCDVRR